MGDAAISSRVADELLDRVDDEWFSNTSAHVDKCQFLNRLGYPKSSNIKLNGGNYLIICNVVVSNSTNMYVAMVMLPRNHVIAYDIPRVCVCVRERGVTFCFFPEWMDRHKLITKNTQQYLV